MASTRKIVVLPGDGIGPEIVDQALRVLDAVNDTHQLGTGSTDASVWWRGL